MYSNAVCLDALIVETTIKSFVPHARQDILRPQIKLALNALMIVTPVHQQLVAQHAHPLIL
jgi:hypothetical protein